MNLLVIEDDVSLASALERGLAYEGFAVDVANDGDSGFDLACSGDYDAIICDLMLPGMNGFRVCSALREREIWTPVLVLTAKDGDYDHAEALDSGADDYLTKPFAFLVLLAHLRALLRRSGRTRPPVMHVGDLWIDPVSHRAGRGDTEVRLTTREFSLLEYFLHHPGEALSKENLLDHVWGRGFDGDQNIVEVYVGYLRKKLDVPFGCSTIETVRGIGYRLAASG